MKTTFTQKTVKEYNQEQYHRAIELAVQAVHDNNVSLLRWLSIQEIYSLQEIYHSYGDLLDDCVSSIVCKYGCGGILIVNGKEYIIRKSGNEKDAIKLKNVAGEIFGAITIMKAARKLKLKRMKLYFDFSGIEDIALSKVKPKQKNRFLLAYRDFFAEINKYMKIDFCKVKSHSGIELNNKADRLAKQAVGLRKEI